MIESPPKIKTEQLLSALINTPSEIVELIDRTNEKYEYWSEVKYKKLPENMSNEDFWIHVKASRLRNRINVWEKYGINLTTTNQIQRMCHEFDMNFGGSWGTKNIIPDENKEQYLISSLMEEAISSSQMEGASTTREHAKMMLRKKMNPKDKSQQMIFNNYQTIRFIVENKDAPLSKELFLKVHALMTENTLDNPNDTGKCRSNNDVVVADGITPEIVHHPPRHEEIPEFIETLCVFFNENNSKTFIHPIVKGIIAHFMIAYVHPFVDGNGRTARALFYWYMLKQGYWLTEYLSISKIIAKSKKSYEKAYLYTELDDNDVGYFVTYNLRVLNAAFIELQNYIKRKVDEKTKANTFLKLGNINERQAGIIKIIFENSKVVLTVKEIQEKFHVVAATAKRDILGLIEIGVLSEIAFNKVKRGYIKGDEFDDVIKTLK